MRPAKTLNGGRYRMPAPCLSLTMMLLASAALVAQKQGPMAIRLDLADAPRRLLHVTEQLPVHPGENTFLYPQWIPSHELPDGPIDNLVGLTFHANGPGGVPVRWRRDLADAYRFHVNVSAGITALTATYDILETKSHFSTQSRNPATSHLVMVEPSEVVLYPSGRSLHDLAVTHHSPPRWLARRDCVACARFRSACPQWSGYDLLHRLRRTADRLADPRRRPLPPVSARSGDPSGSHPRRLRGEGG